MFVSVNQLTIMIGVLSAQVINWLISLHDKQIPDDATAQISCKTGRTAGTSCTAGAGCSAPWWSRRSFFLLMLFVPESVRWLIKNGRDERAGRVLEKIGGSAYATKELADIKATISAEEVATVHFRDLLDPMLKILFIGVCLALLQQWCGMNVIFYYAADIFTAAGYGIKQTMLNIAVIGLTMVVYLCRAALFTVDRVGQRNSCCWAQPP